MIYDQLICPPIFGEGPDEGDGHDDDFVHMHPNVL